MLRESGCVRVFFGVQTLLEHSYMKESMSLLPARYRYDGIWNGYDYDSCIDRLPNFYYPSLAKPIPYYYRCVNKIVVYGRCPVNQCVTR